MTVKTIGLGRVLPGMASLALLGTAAAAPAQQILSAVQSSPDTPGFTDKVVSNTAGALVATTNGGADTRALTDFGVNKAYASGNDIYRQYATSAWVDSYVVGGTTGSTVSLSFTFSIDGLAAFSGPSPTDFNFAVYALRGSGWSLSGYNGGGTNPYSSVGGGENYERPVLEWARPDGGVTEMDSRDFDGFYNYQANAAMPGEPGAFGSHVQLIGSGPASYYSVETYNGVSVTERRLFATGYQTYVNGTLVTAQSGTYADGKPLSTALSATRTSLLANYSLLDMKVLCGSGECPAGAYPGSDLTLSFSLAAGSTFSLASVLSIDDLKAGTVDFFHTAKVTGITVSDGATLTSQSGTLQASSDGNYGYAAVAALPGAVPEPATWALMIGGFALAGGMMRRRTVRFAVA